MLVPNTLLQFPNQELLSSVGTFISYNIGCWVLQPDVSPPREGYIPLQARALHRLCIWRSTWQGFALLGWVHFMFFCAQYGTLRQMVWALGDLLASGSSSGQCWCGRVSQQPLWCPSFFSLITFITFPDSLKSIRVCLFWFCLFD